MDIPDAAVSDQAAAVGTQLDQAIRALEGDPGTSRVLRRTVGQVQAIRLRSLYALESRSGRRGVSRCARGWQLVRRRVQSAAVSHHRAGDDGGPVGTSRAGDWRSRRPRQRSLDSERFLTDEQTYSGRAAILGSRKTLELQRATVG